MTLSLNEPVTVTITSDHHSHRLFPKTVIWKNHSYIITKLGLHHTYRHGTTLYHIFSVCSRNLFLRLKLDTTTLHWTLEQLSDGLSS